MIQIATLIRQNIDAIIALLMEIIQELILMTIAHAWTRAQLRKNTNMNATSFDNKTQKLYVIYAVRFIILILQGYARN